MLCNLRLFKNRLKVLVLSQNDDKGTISALNDHFA